MRVQKDDLIKITFAKENNIWLIRTIMKDFDKIDEILTENQEERREKSKWLILKLMEELFMFRRF